MKALPKYSFDIKFNLPEVISEYRKVVFLLLFIYLFIKSIILISSAQVSLGLPRFLLPGGLHFITFFGSLPSSEEIRGLMEEKGLMEEDWNDRDKWKKKII